MKKVHPAVVSAQAFQVADHRPVERLFDDAEGKDRRDKALSRYPERKGALLPMLAYAQERLQMRSFTGPKNPEGEAEVREVVGRREGGVAIAFEHLGEPKLKNPFG